MAGLFILVVLIAMMIVVAGFASWVRSHRQMSVQTVAGVRGEFLNDAAIEISRLQNAGTNWNLGLTNTTTYQLGVDTVTVTVTATGWP